MTKRIFIILIVLLLLGLGTWYFFSAPANTSVSETLSNILPFGSGGDASSTRVDSDTNPRTATTTSEGVPVANVFKISDVPVAGAIALNKNGTLVVRYSERATGHIYDVDPVTLIKTKIVNTTTPKIYEAIFKTDGSAVLYRKLASDEETIETKSIALIPPTGTSTSDFYTTKISNLSGNISALSAGEKAVFYTTRNLPQITSSLFDGSKPTTLWNANFNQWRLAAIKDTSVVLTTKATSRAAGYAYNLSAKGSLSKLLGPLTALIAIPDATMSRIAFSYADNGNTYLYSKNLTAGKIYNILPATFAEKCVWSVKNAGILFCGAPSAPISQGEPDLWYQGNTHYTDRLWKFDTDKDFADMLLDPKKTLGLDIDSENLFLSPAEDYLFFTNRNDLTLWALKLE